MFTSVRQVHAHLPANATPPCTLDPPAAARQQAMSCGTVVVHGIATYHVIEGARAPSVYCIVQKKRVCGNQAFIGMIKITHNSYQGELREVRSSRHSDLLLPKNPIEGTGHDLDGVFRGVLGVRSPDQTFQRYQNTRVRGSRGAFGFL